MMDKMMKESTPEQMQAGMEEWKTWMKSHASHMSDIGAPVGKNKRVSSSGVEDMRNEVLGYSIVEAESQDAATEMFKNSPQTKMEGGYVDVMELKPVEGM